MLAFFNGKYLPEESISIRWNDRGFNFADGCYEVIRSYKGKIFRMQDHVKRMDYSLRELQINSDAPKKMEGIARHLLAVNHPKHEHALIYYQVTRGAHKRMHRFPPVPTEATFVATSSSFTPYSKEFEEGAGIILTEDYRWGRCDIKSIGLIPNVMSQQKAWENKAVEAVFVRNGIVTEGTHTNVACIKNGIFITPPLSNHILAGVTRAAVIEICHELGITVVEKEISEKEFLEMDEIMVVGTTLEVTPAVSLNYTKVGNGHPGDFTRKIQEEFRKKVLM